MLKVLALVFTEVMYHLVSRSLAVHESPRYRNYDLESINNSSTHAIRYHHTEQATRKLLWRRFQVLVTFLTILFVTSDSNH